MIIIVGKFNTKTRIIVSAYLIALQVHCSMTYYAKLWITMILLMMVSTAPSFCQSKDYMEWYLSTPDSLDTYNQDIYVRELGTGKDTVIVIHGGFGANHDYMLDAIQGLEKNIILSYMINRVLCSPPHQSYH